jgi:hypothetical protein
MSRAFTLMSEEEEVGMNEVEMEVVVRISEEI